MPYIAQLARQRVRQVESEAQVAGELNYEITTLIRSYLARQGRTYNTMNEIVGALESAKVEFQRRIVAPYEDRKIQENGDVYEAK